MGAQTDLHLINARLPLNGDDHWYELKAEDGVWTSVLAHPHRISLPEAKAINDRRVFSGSGSGPVDLEGRVALPGFVDMHMHLDKALTLPQVGNVSGTLMEAIHNYGSKAAGFSKTEIRERMVETALMGLRHGTIHMRTHLDIAVWLSREVAYRTVEAALEAKEELKGRVRLQLFPMLSFDRQSAAMGELARELIALGMDGLGGCPHLSESPEADIRHLFETAAKLAVPLDLHADETDNPAVRTVEAISRTALNMGYEGKVAVGHLCSLSSMPLGEAQPLMELIAEAQVGVVTLPAANLYLQGRGDEGPVRRGVTRVRELQQAGVKVAAASDNIRDPFHPFGRGDPVQIGLLTAYAAHMGSPADYERILRMITETPASLMGLSASYGIKKDRPADLVVVDAANTGQLLVEESPSRWVAVDGRWVSINVKEKWMG